MTTLQLRRPELCLWMLGFIVVFAAADFELTILHTNDVHARIEEADTNGAPCTPKLQAESKCFGGVARIRTMVNEKRRQYPGHTLLLDAGDQFQGTLWFYVFGGLVSAKFMNLIGYDAMAIGNHEFDSGIQGLLPFARNLTFPLLSSNIDVSNTPVMKDLVKKSTVVDVAGQQIGIVGYTTTETPHISSPETLTFVEELGAVQAEIDKLVAQGINIIIAVGHSGYEKDLDLAKRLKDVDVVVGGHTNTFLYNGTAPSSEHIVGTYPTVVQSVHPGHTVLVVQDYAYGKYLGELHVRFSDAGQVLSWAGNPILLDHSVQKDNETEAITRSFLPRLNSLKTEIIGHSNVDLRADRILCRTTECSLGNLVTDAIVQQSLRRNVSDGWADASIAVVNAGGLRSSILPGPITLENVIFVQPFRNTVDIIDISGKTLISMLEYGASKWSEEEEKSFGGFLQVSGLQITYDIRRPVWHRVVDVQAVCTRCQVPQLEPLDSQSTYRILTSSFIIGGGDGYSMLPGNITKIFPVGYLDTDILLDYIKKSSPITTGLQKRIRHLKDLSESHLCQEALASSSLSLHSSNGMFDVFHVLCISCLMYSMFDVFHV